LAGAFAFAALNQRLQIVAILPRRNESDTTVSDLEKYSTGGKRALMCPVASGLQDRCKQKTLEAHFPFERLRQDEPF
jgi:hypothetical protein